MGNQEPVRFESKCSMPSTAFIGWGTAAPLLAGSPHLMSDLSSDDRAVVERIVDRAPVLSTSQASRLSVLLGGAR